MILHVRGVMLEFMWQKWTAALLCGAGWLGAQSVTVIQGGWVVDGSGAPARQARVVIRGGRIAEVGGSGSVPGAQVIEAAGRTLIPGLFDLHTHLPYSGLPGLYGDWPKNLAAYLLHGVTSAVDFGTYPETFEPMRRLLRDGRVIGPRLHLAARMTTPGGHGAEAGRGDFFSQEVTTPREAAAAVERLLPYQPDAIKVFTDGWRYGAGPDMTSMDEATLAAIVKHAHAKGMEVLTHTVTLERAKQAARAGIDVLAHGIGDARADDEFLMLLREKQTTYVSTLAVYESKTWPGRDVLAAFLDPAALAVALRMSSSTTPPTASRRRRWANLTANVAAARQAGARIGAGTDAGVTGTIHGRSSIRELELLVEAGLTPFEAIAAATSTAARALGVAAERGVIAPGQLADLVLIDGKPHERIADLYRVAGVWMEGRALDLAALRRTATAPGTSPLPALAARPLIDDMENVQRTSVDTLRVNASDAGHDNSRSMFQQILRAGAGAGHALAIQARMSEKESPFAQVWLPLSRGGVEPVDAARFQGIEFESRGDGRAYRLIAQRRGVRDGKFPSAPFQAGAKWQRQRISFSALGLTRPADLTVLAFEIARAPGTLGWLELDNVRFY
ncbi:MAG: CIA30 family protein [Bryobacterales bacterium]|nr:CIA30 family protein [Bryobacterales bacterium]